MYLSHYNLKTEPFKITTDPEFLWLGEKHKEALATLKYGILGNKGILLLTGDVGTGKTTLINALLNSLGNDTLVATVPDPGLDRMDFFNYVANAFNINKTFYSKGEFTLYLSHFLKAANSENKKVLLIIDEAQRLNNDLLEEIRLLSNIELQNTKLINLFFVGQKEFNDIILLDENKALRQRISLRYHIDPLNLDETGEYIKYRLMVAGAKKNFFTSDAMAAVYSFSKGYPRLINILCDYSLLAGFVRDKKSIGRQMVVECAEELRIPQEDGGESETPQAGRKAALEMPSAESEVLEQYGHENSERMGINQPKQGFYKKIGVGALVVALALSIGYNFHDISTAPSIRSYFNGLWLKMDSGVEKFTNWVNNVKGPKSEEEKVVPITLPPIQKAQNSVEQQEAPSSKPLDIVLPRGKEPGSMTSGATVSSKDVEPSLKPSTHRPMISTPAVRPASSPLAEADSASHEKFTPTIQRNNSPRIHLNREEPEQTPQTEAEKQPQDRDLGETSQKSLENLPSEGIPLIADHSSLPNTPARKEIILFDANSFSLNGESINSLSKIIAFIKEHPSSEIIIKGFTDDTGPFVYNERLSIFRAYSVKSYLVDHGVDPKKAKAFGMGPRPPLDEAGNRIAPQLIRSVEVELYLK